MSLRQFFSTSGGELSPAIIVRRALFLVLLCILSYFFLGISFRGLTSSLGIDQAQIAREVARSNGFSTKVVRPAALFRAEQHKLDKGEDEQVRLVHFPDTYHSPLNPLLNSVVLKLFKGNGDWTWKEEVEKVYFPDRIIAGTSILLFLCSIGINYLLISRIFDTKLGGVTALLMLLCELNWQFTQTGLPQMLMLFLFSFASYFLYKAIENQQAEKGVTPWVLLAGGFYGLLALSHWLTIWIFLGFLIFVSFYFQPRGVLAAISIAIFLVITGIWGARNISETGNPFGTAYLTMLATDGSREAVMREYSAEATFSMRGLPTRLALDSISQLKSLYSHLGAIVAAPLFFLALLHPFKRKEIADARWCILLMWLFAVIGMSFFGVGGEIHSNQLHILFAPIMTGYGLAILSVLWTRLGVSSNSAVVMNGHLIIAVAISIIPLVLSFWPKLQASLTISDRQEVNPRYSLAIACQELELEEAEIIVSDNPYHAAWYGDKTTLWLPNSPSQLEEIANYTEGNKQPIRGLLLVFREALQKSLADLMQVSRDGPWADIYLETLRIARQGRQYRPAPRPTGIPFWFSDTDSRVQGRGLFFLRR
ncbi:MAG: hypothetical protein AAGA58_01720 [Verrucomicrobiota bacterium]